MYAREKKFVPLPLETTLIIPPLPTSAYPPAPPSVIGTAVYFFGLCGFGIVPRETDVAPDVA